jgi:magnesium-transporting ATPase (P-type)
LNRKVKNISGIIGLIIGISTFSYWYLVALNTHPEVPIQTERILHYGYWIEISLLLFALTLNSKNKIKQLIWYAGSNFYLFLTITYFLNRNFDILIRQNKIICTVILMVISCIIYYFFSFRSRSEK